MNFSHLPILYISVLYSFLFNSGLMAQESDLDLSKFCSDHFTFVRIVYDSVVLTYVMSH